MNWNKIKYWFSDDYRIYHHNIYINLRFHRLIKDWWKVRKYFRFPNIKFYKGVSGGIEFDYYMENPGIFNNKLFGFHIEGLGHKYKWYENVYTYCPEIVCVFNRKVLFTIKFESPKLYTYVDSPLKDMEYGKIPVTNNHMYWQSIIDCIYNDKTLFKVHESNIYSSYDKETNESVIEYIDGYLTNKGKLEFLKQFNINYPDHKVDILPLTNINRGSHIEYINFQDAFQDVYPEVRVPRKKD